MSGTLFVVGTPIGNLEDLTFRALRTLKEVDVIAAEDTRRTAKLLAHYEIRKPLLSLHEHNEHREAPRVVERILQGASVALVTDAGTPGIADPGARLVDAVHRAGGRVVPIPGASAVATALSVSGFSAGEFVFMGFPPRSGLERERWFQRLKADERVVVLCEAPHRVERTLSELRTEVVNRPIFVTREITKINEQLVMYSENDLPRGPIAKGEFTIVVGPAHSVAQTQASEADVVDIFGRLIELAGLDQALALQIMDRTFSLSPIAIKKAIKRQRILVKQQSQGSS